MWADLTPAEKLAVRSRVNNANNVRAKRVGAPGVLTYSGIFAELRRTPQCDKCHAALTVFNFGIYYKQPLAFGGWNALDNVALVCSSCSRHVLRHNPPKRGYEASLKKRWILLKETLAVLGFPDGVYTQLEDYLAQQKKGAT